mmetsp:Transcript_122500/g.354073  ORF Transcript_122500/g.354073 Transcript_122500/m.354073 type:complete len:532 (+) Transcript_122500:89-1684(+)
MVTLTADGDPLKEVLRDVSRALADSVVWENGYDTIFEILRRTIMRLGRGGTLDLEPVTDDQIRDCWIFLLQVRRLHRTRRRRVAECLPPIRECHRWMRVFSESQQVQEAMSALDEEAHMEMLQGTIPDEDSPSPPPVAPGSNNPWGAPQQQQQQQHRDPWAAGGGGGGAAKPAAGANNPWGAPRRADAPAAGGTGAASANNPFRTAAAQGGKGAPLGDQAPSAWPAGGGYPSEAPGDQEGSRAGQVGAKVAGNVRNAAHSLREANERHDVTGKIGRGTHAAVDKTKEFNEKHQVTHKVAEAGRNTVQAAKDANREHDITGKVAHGTAVAAKKTAEVSKQAFNAARETNQKHDITGKISTGASNAASAAKEANQKHDITGKIGRGAVTVGSGVVKGFSAVKEAACGGSQKQLHEQQGQQQQHQAPPRASNPFGAPAAAPEPRQSAPTNPWAQTAAGPSPSGGPHAFAAQLDQRSQGMQQKFAQKAANTAATKYTGGLVTSVPPGVSNAALDYAKKNPKDAAKFVQGAAKMAT